MTVAEPCHCIALRQAERHVARYYERVFAPLGINVDQFATLARLHRRGPTSITSLSDLLVMDRAVMSYVLKALTSRDLVAIEPACRDRRCRVAALTQAGAALYVDARRRWLLMNAQVDAALGERALALRVLLKEVEGVDLRFDAPPAGATAASTPALLAE